MDEIEAKIDVEFPCPYCGVKCMAATGPVPTIFHAVPFCQKFIDEDSPIEFLQAARWPGLPSV